jgi:type III restriction enzyme
MGFNFERNLPHQDKAVQAIIDVFQDVALRSRHDMMANHEFELTDSVVLANIQAIQKRNDIKDSSPVLNEFFNLDVKMETGTGKTYTYTKTIYEINRQYGINKFVIVVPTLPIKAGTEQFLKSDSTILHFKEEYRKILELYVVQSQKNKKTKSKREYFPFEVMNFVRATHLDDKIHVLLVNTGMLNSVTMNKVYDDTSLFGYAETPFNLIAKTKPFVIIDEPHRFKRSGVSYENLLKFKPQCMIRFGATFPEIRGKKDYENLLYDLDAVKAFNDDLVKGVVVHIPQFEGRKNAKLTLISLDGKSASFKYVDETKEQTHRLEKGDSLSIISSDLHDLWIENLNKSVVELSNGITLEKNQAIHPSSFSDTYQEVLMKKAIDEHFDKEKELFALPVKIKPLTLFFIDDVHAYREMDGRTPYLKDTFERLLKQKMESLLQEDISNEYADYLRASLANLANTHGGYFSRDNSDKDDKIQSEIEEILRDKEKLLSYRHEGTWNVRRFIFSKWTLKEGWDNPNVFTICKLRSSGSEISKLQEVGRGLRLPVNEAMFRVKSSQFELSYIVDFTEREFAEQLVKEINDSSPVRQLSTITDVELKELARIYNKTEDEIFGELLSHRFIDRHGKVNDDKRAELYMHYPELNKTLKKDKVRKGEASKQYVTVRQSNYEEFKQLWEAINQKVFIDYKLGPDDSIRDLLVDLLKNEKIADLDTIKFVERKVSKDSGGTQVVVSDIGDSPFTVHQYVETMPYNEFLRMVSKATSIPIQTIHAALVKYHQTNPIDNDTFFTRKTAINLSRKYREKIASVMLEKIEYKKMDISVHPTALTNIDGTLKKIAAHSIGTKFSDATPNAKYLYNELFYDSNENTIINEEISEVIVFGKIPKNSIRIPVINGQTYSPDFAYVVKSRDGETRLNIVIESKNKEARFLSDDEKDKITLAERFFETINDTGVKIVFQKQMKGKHVSQIISEIIR